MHLKGESLRTENLQVGGQVGMGFETRLLVDEAGREALRGRSMWSSTKGWEHGWVRGGRRQDWVWLLVRHGVGEGVTQWKEAEGAQ